LAHPWTPEEDKRLQMLVEACKPIELIAARAKTFHEGRYGPRLIYSEYRSNVYR
jgi:hypothetical protein